MNLKAPSLIAEQDSAMVGSMISQENHPTHPLPTPITSLTTLLAAPKKDLPLDKADNA